MKKRAALGTAVLICCVVFFSGSAFAGGTLKIGIDSGGQLTNTVSGTNVSATEDVNDSASLAMEGFGELNKNFDLGGGIEFQMPREMTKYTGKFNFVPIYLMMRLHPEMSDLTPYLTAQLGFAIFNGDTNFKGNLTLTPGGHVGVGVGVILDKNFLFEFLATVDTGGAEYNGEEVFKVSYSKVTFSVGINF